MAEARCGKCGYWEQYHCECTNPGMRHDADHRLTSSSYRCREFAPRAMAWHDAPWASSLVCCWSVSGEMGEEDRSEKARRGLAESLRLAEFAKLTDPLANLPDAV